MKAHSETHILYPGSCFFVCTAEPTVSSSADSKTLLFWINIKINHVDFQQDLAGRILRLPCAASTLLAAYDLDHSVTLTQILEKALIEVSHSEPYDNSYTFGMVPDATVKSPELSSFYMALLDFLEENLQADFTTAQLADSLGCSSRHLNQLLQKHFSF